MRALVLIALVASPVAADCPTAADMDGGIRLLLKGEETETYHRLSPDLVSVTYSDPGEWGMLTMAANGIYILSIENLDGQGLPDPGHDMHYDFPMSPAEMPRPETGQTWQVPVVRHEDGKPTETEIQIYSFGPDEPWAIGPCTYNRMHISVQYPESSGERIEHLSYIQELGFAVWTGTSEPGAPDTNFEYLGIEAVE